MIRHRPGPVRTPPAASPAEEAPAEGEPIPAPSHASHRQTTIGLRQWPAALSSCRSRPIAPSARAKSPARGPPATGAPLASPGPSARLAHQRRSPADQRPPAARLVVQPAQFLRCRPNWNHLALAAARLALAHAASASTTTPWSSHPALAAAPRRAAAPEHRPAPPARRAYRGVDESSSSLLIGRGGGTSSVLKPCSRAQVRASPWIPSASRIFCVAAMILLTAAPDAFAASALHRAWIAWISANLFGQRFFRRKNVIYFFVAFVCYLCQSAPQIVDFVGSGI